MNITAADIAAAETFEDSVRLYNLASRTEQVAFESWC